MVTWLLKVFESSRLQSSDPNRSGTASNSNSSQSVGSSTSISQSRTSESSISFDDNLTSGYEGGGEAAIPLKPPSLETDFKIRSDTFSTPQIVPKTKPQVFLYRTAEFSGKIRERFEVLKDVLKSKVDVSNLKQHVRNIIYELILGGFGPAVAKPTVVVFCPEKALKGLRKLFDTAMVNRHRSGPPSLGIVYYASEWIVRRASEIIEIRLEDNMTLCGSKVGCCGKMATIALTLEVNNALHALTVDHLFATKPFEIATSETDQSESLLSSPSETQDWTDEVEYVDSDPDNSPLASPQVEPGSVADMNNATLYVTSFSSASPEQGVRIYPRRNLLGPPTSAPSEFSSIQQDKWMSTESQITSHSNLEPDAPYLDWALITLQSSMMAVPDTVRPNMVHSNTGLNVGFITTSIEEPFTAIVEVLVLTENGRAKRGHLLPTPAYIGHEAGVEAAAVFPIVFPESLGTNDDDLLGGHFNADNETAIKAGECGSLVVVADTLEVFGHVVAASLMGDAYAVPFSATMRQIRASTAPDICYVAISDALELLVSFYERQAGIETPRGWFVDDIERRATDILRLAIDRGDVEKIHNLFRAGLRHDIKIPVQPPSDGFVPVWMLKNYGSLPPMQYAVCVERLEAFMTLETIFRVKEDSQDPTDVEGRTPLSYAAELGYLQFVEYLIGTSERRGSDAIAPTLGNQPLFSQETRPMSVTFKHRTPLSYAAASGNTGVIEILLLSDNKDLNLSDEHDLTPLHHAVKAGFKDAVRLLLTHKDTLVNACDLDGRTVLSFAAELGELGIVRLLLAHDCINIDLKDYNGKTAKHYAATAGHDAVVEELEATDVYASNEEVGSIHITSADFDTSVPRTSRSRRENVEGRARAGSKSSDTPRANSLGVIRRAQGLAARFRAVSPRIDFIID